MKSTLSGMFTSLLGLTLLEAFLAGSQTHNVGGILRSLGAVTRRLTDPAVPAIPDLRPGPASKESHDGSLLAPGPDPLGGGQLYDPWGGKGGAVSTPTPRIPTPSTSYV